VSGGREKKKVEDVVLGSNKGKSLSRGGLARLVNKGCGGVRGVDSLRVRQVKNFDKLYKLVEA